MMEKIMFAQKAFIINEGKVLLIKKSENAPVEPNKWEVPGGRIKFGESIDEHIKREVREEVGIDIEVGEPFDMWTFFMDSFQNIDRVQVVVVARFCSPKSLNINILGQDKTDYISEYYWVPVQEVLRYDLIPDMIPTMRKCIRLLEAKK